MNSAHSLSLPKFDSKTQQQILEGFNSLHIEQLLNQSSDLLNTALKHASEYQLLLEKEEELSLQVKKIENNIKLERMRLYETGSDRPEVSAAKTPEKIANWRKLDATSTKDYLELLNKVDKEELLKWEPDAELPESKGLNTYSRISTFQSVIQNQIQRPILNRHEDMHELEEFMYGMERKITEESLKFEEAQLLEINNLRREKKAFDYSARKQELRMMMVKNRGDAYARMIKAHEGIQFIYGDLYQNWLEINSDTTQDGTLDDSTNLHRLYLWLQNAISFVAWVSQHDQSIIYTVSIRSILGDKWSKFIEQVKIEKTAQFVFDLPRPLVLDAFENFRLRGISAVMVTPRLSPYVWSLIANTPRVTIHGTGQTIKNISKTIYFGRVESQLSTRSPDLCGVIATHNLNPFTPGSDSGTQSANPWKIKVLCPSTFEEDVDSSPPIQDIRIDLYLTALPSNQARILARQSSN